jgi:hypothetical protein
MKASPASKHDVEEQHVSRTDVTARPGPSGTPVVWSDLLGRRIRQDGLETLGMSSQTLAEQHLARGEWEVAADLAEYFLDEMTRINNALFTWLEVILAFPGSRFSSDGVADSRQIVAAMRGFGPGDGDLLAVERACAAEDVEPANARLETMRVRVAAVHDQLVWWIQHLLAGIAERHGEDAVRDVVVLTYEELWRARYELWPRMTPVERLQISVEGMRGHLSGPRHRGDVGILEERDRFTMVLDPCGSCGVLRRGDPDSGRQGCDPAGTTVAHDWAWNRVGVGWYAVHSPIVMEWLQMREGRPPMRPLTGCDSAGPCRWFIYKEIEAARPEDHGGSGADTSRAR